MQRDDNLLLAVTNPIQKGFRYWCKKFGDYKIILQCLFKQTKTPQLRSLAANNSM